MSEEETRFEDELGDLRPLKTRDRVPVKPSRANDAGLERRRQAATESTLPSGNFWATEHAPPLGPHDIISFVRPGVQHGVFHKLRRGAYEPEATLDLHRSTIEGARRELWDFIQQGSRYQLRTIMVIHGKGDRSPRPAVLKSYVTHWLKDLPEVLAYHSALPYHGGAGALYILLKKSAQASERNRARFAGCRHD